MITELTTNDLYLVTGGSNALQDGYNDGYVVGEYCRVVATCVVVYTVVEVKQFCDKVNESINALRAIW